MPREQYQTVSEIAERLKVAEATVRSWIRDGALRAIDIGKGWRIADSDFEAFLLDHETRARAQEQEHRTPPPADGRDPSQEGAN